MNPFWILISILGIVLEIYGFYLSVRLENQIRKHILTVIFVTLIICTFVALGEYFYHRSHVRNVSKEIVGRLKTGPKTIDQLSVLLFPPDFSLLSEALNELTADGKVGNDIIEVYNDNREQFRVRIFYLK